MTAVLAYNMGQSHDAVMIHRRAISILELRSKSADDVYLYLKPSLSETL